MNLVLQPHFHHSTNCDNTPITPIEAVVGGCNTMLGIIAHVIYINGLFEA